MMKEEKKCQVVMSDGSHCGRMLHDWEYCFFHSPKEDRSVEFFQDELNKIFNDKSLKNYDFTKFIFPEGVVFPKILKKKTIFKGAIFQDEVRFITTSFENEADFSGVSFEKGATFANVVFQGKARFERAMFKGQAQFVKSTFQCSVNFFRTTFAEETEFSSVGEIVFPFNIAEAILTLGEEEDKRTIFAEEVDFRNVRFLKPEKVRFRKINLSKFRFLGTDLRKVEFIDVDWYKEEGAGRNKIYDEVSPDPENRKLDHPLITQVYKRLRANYEENLNYAEAGDFHIGEMEMRRKDKREKISNRFAISLYMGISYYGESFLLPLGWLLLFLLILFPLSYMFVGITPKIGEGQIQYYIDLYYKAILPNSEKLKDFCSSLTYSLSVFSLLRERPYQTINNPGHILTVLESILSPTLIAFFLLALRRRFKRLLIMVGARCNVPLLLA
jgi:uncharacterized protein YjbI with pentapeptide repeats